MNIFRKTYDVTDICRSLKENLSSGLDEPFRSLILHGPHADETLKVDDSVPVGILIVLPAINPRSLESLANAYRNARGIRQIAPMVLTVEELHASTDVFPITFWEMKRCHCLLAGEDVLADLEIPATHLRLRCEQELKNLLLRMQSSYLTKHETPKRLRLQLSQNLLAFVRTLGAAFELKRVARPKDTKAALLLAAQEFGLEQQTLRTVLEYVEDQHPLDKASLMAVYAATIGLVGQAAAAIDRLPEVGQGYEILEDRGAST